MKNSERFLFAFNSVEMALKEFNKTDEYVPFSRLIQIAKKSDAVIRKYYDDLKEFSELRNAIVHNTIDINFAIAEPHDHVVEKIEMIVKEIKQPKRVIPMYQKEVIVFQASNTLKELLNIINKYAYSKFPIYNGNQFLGLLSKKGIVNWLARNIGRLNCVNIPDTLNISNTMLMDILKYESKNINYKFIDKNKTIYEVKELFRNFETALPSIDALLITENGNEHEQLLGIITPYDIVNHLD